MLKKRFIKKMLIASAVLFTFALMYFIPDSRSLKPKQELEYVNSEVKEGIVYLYDKNNMLGRVKVAVNSDAKDKKAMELLSILIREKNENKIPSGFKAVLPSDTVIRSLTYKDRLIKVDFSKELLDVKDYEETKIVESIVYTLTSIEEVDKVIIYVEGNILNKLPKSKINLSSTLDRSYGINKSYNITTYKDISSYNVYYLSKYDDYSYYVPVTRYVNDNRDRVKIIVEELALGSNDDNLMSYLNYETKLEKASYEKNKMVLTFNESIFSDTDTREVLDEVKEAISLSIKDSYDVNEVVFNYKDKEICKIVVKMLE